MDFDLWSRDPRILAMIQGSRSCRNFFMTIFPDEFEQKDKVQGRVVTMTKGEEWSWIFRIASRYNYSQLIKVSRIPTSLNEQFIGGIKFHGWLPIHEKCMHTLEIIMSAIWQHTVKFYSIQGFHLIFREINIYIQGSCPLYVPLSQLRVRSAYGRY